MMRRLFQFIDPSMILPAQLSHRLLLQQNVRQVFGNDLVADAHHDRVLDGVLQFANIARPVVAHEQCARFGRDALERAIRISRHIWWRSKWRAGEYLRDARAAAARRSGNHIEAIVKILAKLAGLDRLLQVLVGGGEDACLELDGRVPPRRSNSLAARRAAASPAAAAPVRRFRRGRSCRLRRPRACLS